MQLAAHRLIEVIEALAALAPPSPEVRAGVRTLVELITFDRPVSAIDNVLLDALIERAQLGV